MTPVRWLIQAGLWCLDFFVSERTPRTIAWAIMLGVILPFSPYYTLQSLFIAAALFLLPVPLLVVFAVAIPLTVIAPLGSSYYSSIGQFFLNLPSLQGLWRAFYQLPLFPYTRFNNTIQLGSLIVGFSLAVIVGGITHRVLSKNWNRLLDFFDKSPSWNSLSRTELGIFLFRPPKKMWIRWQSLWLATLGIPFLAVFSYFYFPPWLHSQIESTLSSIAGSPVTVDSSNVRLWSPSLELKGISLKRADPRLSLFHLDRFRLELSPYPLLAKKFLITDLTLEGLRLGVNDRSSTSFSSVNEEGEINAHLSFDSLIAGNLYKKIHEEYGSNPLTAVSELGAQLELSRKIIPLIPRLHLTKEILTNSPSLKSSLLDWEKKIEALSPKFKAEDWRKEWETAKEAPESKLKFLKKTAGAIAEADEIQREIHKELAEQQAKLRTFREAIPKAISEIRGDLHLPQFDSADATPTVFGPRLVHFVERITHFIVFSRNFMPSGTRTVVKQGGEGNYSHHFSAPGEPLLLLLPRVEIGTGTSPQGNIKGFLSNFTSDPSILGKPLEAQFSFEIPGQDKWSGKITLSVDHTTNVPQENISVRLEGFPLHGWQLSPARPIEVLLEKGKGHLEFDLAFKGFSLEAKGFLNVEGAETLVNCTDRDIQDLLTAELKKVTDFRVEGAISGTVEEPTLTMKSDWGVQLQKAIRQAYRTPLAAVEDSIRSNLLDEIDPPLKEQETFLASMERSLTQQVGHFQRGLTELASLANASSRNVTSMKKRK